MHALPSCSPESGEAGLARFLPGELGPGLLEAGVPAFVDELFSRNRDLLTPQEQAVLQASRVLLGGCGSVGGAVVEPLVRLGVGSLVLADPERYELSNLNRQVSRLCDVGRLKVEVLRERIQEINPLLEVRTFPAGLTPENLRDALDGVHVVFDGIDPAASAWPKYLLHKYAAEERIPVISGADLGGKATLYVFDYRRDRRPFFGRASEESHRLGNFAASVRWLGVRAFPADFIPVILDRLQSDRPWPQVAYCVAAMGALGSRAIIDVALGREVPERIAVDVHDATRRPAGRLRERLRLPGRLLRVGLLLRRAARGGLARRRSDPGVAAHLPPDVGVVLNAIRWAPSAHNTQPWQLRLRDGTPLELGWDGDRRLRVGDPTGEGVAYSLGCAIEAAHSLARIEFEPEPVIDLLAPAGGRAGWIRVKGVREPEFLRASGVLRLRSTNRGPYLTDPVGVATLRCLERLAGELGQQLHVATDRTRIARVAELAREGARVLLADEAHVAELLEWLRLSPREPDRREDGMSAESLGLNLFQRAGLRTMKRSPRLIRAAARGGFGRLIGGQVAHTLRRSGAVLLLTITDPSAHGMIAGGRGLMRIWLECTRRGLALQPDHFSVGTEDLRRATAGAFGADPEARPIAVIRIGRALAPAAPSARLPLDHIFRLEDGR